MLIVCRHILEEGSFNFADLLRSLGQSYRKKKTKSKDDFRTNKEKEKGKTNTRFKINHKKSHRTVKTQ